MQVLYEMQYDTVVANRQTNDLKYLTTLATKFNLDQVEFNRRYHSTGVKGQLAQEQQIMQQMKINQLPAYLLTYNGKTYVLKGIPKYEEWQKLIKQVTNDEVYARPVEFNAENLAALIAHHPHISSLELKEAFDVKEAAVINQLKDSSLTKEKLSQQFSIEKNRKEGNGK